MKNLIKKLVFKISRLIVFFKVKTPYDLFVKEEVRDSYLNFKKHFYTSIFFENSYQIREYAIKKSLNYYEQGDLILEFGFGAGKSLNIFSKILVDKKITAFGAPGSNLKEDWVGYIGHPSHEIVGDRDKKPKNIGKNCELIFGWVQDTLKPFLDKNKNKKINFVHMDLDTYDSSLFVLKLIKPYLKQNTIILFDELYNYSGWRVGEYKALKETFDDKEYKYLSFCSKYSQVAIQIL